MKGCLVGQFFDKRLPLHVVRAAVDKLWGKHEMPESPLRIMDCIFSGSGTWIQGIG